VVPSPVEPGVVEDRDDLSLAEIEENPDLLAAEAAVNDLPPPPPSGTPWIAGEGAHMVTFPGPGPDDEPPGEGDDTPPA
jgi:hypothetical protein